MPPRSRGEGEGRPCWPASRRPCPRTQQRPESLVLTAPPSRARDPRRVPRVLPRRAPARSSGEHCRSRHRPLQDESLELQLGGTRLTQVAWGSQRRHREPAFPAPWPGFLAGPRSPDRNSFDDAATRKRATRCGVPFPREVNGPGEEPFKIRKRGFHKGKTFLL